MLTEGAGRDLSIAENTLMTEDLKTQIAKKVHSSLSCELMNIIT